MHRDSHNVSAEQLADQKAPAKLPSMGGEQRVPGSSGNARAPRVIGLVGPAGAGKDTVADYLVSRYGYTKRSLATPIKALLNARFGWKMEWWEDREWKESPTPMNGVTMTDKQHVGLSPRSWAQWLGTEVGRAIAGDDVWIDELLNSAALDARTVIPDVRFPNEAELTRWESGVLIRVERETPPVEGHVSETASRRIECDYAVLNDGTKEELYAQVDRIMENACGA